MRMGIFRGCAREGARPICILDAPSESMTHHSGIYLPENLEDAAGPGVALGLEQHVVPGLVVLKGLALILLVARALYIYIAQPASHTHTHAP
eukprot:COSAG05_NODE_1010_length_6207_cov_3.771447_10_plen_92_part_00